MPTVWRIKMNSGREHVDWDGAKAYARDAGVVGVGWGPAEVVSGASRDVVISAVEALPGWAPTGPKMIARLAEAVADGDLFWTRDRLGRYWLGRVSGQWYYDASPVAHAWDLNNVRPCRWLDRPFHDYEIPGAVVRNFAGVGETLRRIKQPAATRVTTMLWEREADPRAPWPKFTATEALTDLMDPTDVEDVVLLWLQTQGWLLLASSRMRDTPMYEAAFRHRDRDAVGVVSVKSGGSAQVPIPELATAAGEAEAFAFSTHARYSADPEAHGVTAIDPAQIVAFMEDQPELLPPRVAHWLK